MRLSLAATLPDVNNGDGAWRSSGTSTAGMLLKRKTLRNQCFSKSRGESLAQRIIFPVLHVEWERPRPLGQTHGQRPLAATISRKPGVIRRTRPMTAQAGPGPHPMKRRRMTNQGAGRTRSRKVARPLNTPRRFVKPIRSALACRRRSSLFAIGTAQFQVSGKGGGMRIHPCDAGWPGRAPAEKQCPTR